MTSFKKAKSNNWIGVDNDFGDIDCFEPGERDNAIKNNKTISKKRGRNENNNKIKLARSASESEIPSDLFEIDEKGGDCLVSLPEDISEEIWVTKHQPRSSADLAVNIKKVDEVRDWLKRGRGGVLILLGPSGSGKTATLRLLSEELGFSVTEWVNPIEQVNFGGIKDILDSGQRYDPEDSVAYSSKSKQFKDWLRGARYSQLDILSETSSTSKSQLLLIEDLPSQAYSKPEEFQSTLESFSGRRTKTPIVFIISESASAKKSGSVKQIFPPELIAKLKIDTISFNPVTNTNMVKLMTSVATKESRGIRRFRVPDKSTLEMLAESIGGDIRGGLNALQFSCLNNNLDLQKAFKCVNSLNSKTSVKKKGAKAVSKSGDETTQLSKIGGRDQCLVMFHALGKILYSKRTDEMEPFPLPPQLQAYKRRSLIACPEEVLSHTTLPPDPFAAFLHHNYPPFFSELQDVVRLSEYMSTADLLLQDWTSQGKVSLSEYGASVACRAVMHCNTRHPPNLGMRKLTKPEFYLASRSLRNREASIQSIFHTQNIRELATSTLPLLSKIGHPSFSSTQAATITEVGRFSGIRTVSVRSVGCIEQNDVFDESEELEDALERAVEGEECEPEIVAPLLNEDEDILIEDFGDSD